MPTIKVLIAEDHAVVREGLKILISTEPEFEIAGEADNGEQAVELAKKLRPDVVVMDVAMPCCNGVDATRTISREAPDSKVLALSAYSNEDFVRKMLEAGAAGYLTKHSAAEDLLKAIREVKGGKYFLSPRVAQKIRRLSQKSFVNGNRGNHRVHLTRREAEVLQLIAEGMPNKQIAAELGLSIKTVEKHRQAAMDKLDIHDRAGLTRYAIEQGLLNRPQGVVEV